jgi:hypothetical protein
VAIQHLHPLYLIVGLLVADDIVYTSDETSHRGIGGNIDPVQIAALAGGMPLPLQSSLGVDRTKGSQGKLETVASGKRVFAIEYRSFRKRLIPSENRRVELKGHGPKGDRTFGPSSGQL